MKIIKQGLVGNQVACEQCHTIIEVEPQDLQWTHCEPNYYYIFKCPICGERIWIKGSQRFDEMYHQKV